VNQLPSLGSPRITEPSWKHFKNKKPDPCSITEKLAVLEPGVLCGAGGFNHLHPQRKEK